MLHKAVQVGFMTVVPCCMRLGEQPGPGLHDCSPVLHKAVQVGFMTVVLCCTRLYIQVGFMIVVLCCTKLYKWAS